MAVSIFMAAAVLSAVFFVFKLRGAFAPAKSGGPVVWAALAFVLVAGCWVRFGGGGHGFKTFYEEYEIYNAARTYLSRGEMNLCLGGTLDRCEATGALPYPVGVPALAARVMGVTGNLTPRAVFMMNSALGSFVVLFVFLCACLFTGNVRAGLFAGLFAALQPIGVLLSKGGGMETGGMFFVSLFFVFLAMYRAGSGGVPALCGMLAAGVAGFCVTPQYAFVPLLGGVLVMCSRPLGVRGAAAGVVLCLSVLLLKLCGPAFGDAVAFHPGAFLLVLRDNVLKINTAGFYPVIGFVAAAGGALLMFRGTGGAWPAAVFGVVFVGFSSLYGRNFSNGDFVRYSLPLALPLCVFGGLGADWVYGKLQGAAGRFAFVFVAVAISYASYTSRGGLALNDYMQEQHVFLVDSLKQTPRGCSVYATNPSLVMATSGARAFGIDELRPGGRGDACKFMVFDSFCASSMAKECARAAGPFERKAVRNEDILGLYRASLDRLMPRRERD